VTFDELDQTLPNGFDDAKILSIELNYATGTPKFRLSLVVGWPEDLEPERDKYQEAAVKVTGLCFCSVGPPSPGYRFFRTGDPYWSAGIQARLTTYPNSQS
jgi:hypothetical protein